MLLQVGEEMCQSEIKSICIRLYHTMVKREVNSDTVDCLPNATGSRRELVAPVVLSSLSEDVHLKANDDSIIWHDKMCSRLVVDAKKLEKAEIKIQKKQGRRTDPPKRQEYSDSVSDLASASQQISKRESRLDAAGGNRSCDIFIENFDIAFGDRVLLQGASLHLIKGKCYGFIGRNGLGKTTLLKLISSGQLKIPSHISVLHVEQEVTGDETSALQSVLESDERRERLLRKEHALIAHPDPGSVVSENGGGDDEAAELRRVYEELDSIESAKAPARASQILSGLGFGTLDQIRPTREFSGGWRMRLALARALFMKPDLLLLDEPTNMLDMKAIIWLETYLQDWLKTILVVSHDRQFLNSIATDILHLHSMRLDCYRGNYDAFHRTREEKLKNQRKEYDAQKQYRDHIQVFIDRFRYNANRASQVQSKLKLLDRLPKLTPVEKESSVVFRFPDVEKLSPPILQLDDVCFAYNSHRLIFSNITVNANMDSRICIVGENGAGKSTLLKLLLGTLQPTNGHRHAHRNLRIGYFTQHHVDQLDMGLTSLELLMSRFPGKPAEFYRSHLGGFGVSGDLATRPVCALSGGQKSRVAFAAISMSRPNFLILDEPTNHLDMETIEALGEVLEKFLGGVILVSHNERLIRKLCNELWVVTGCCVRSLDGGIDHYKRLVQSEIAAAGVTG